MEKWRQLCGQQAARLKSALEVCKHATALVNHGAVRKWVEDDDILELKKTQKMIENKLPRLERGEFHIAVVGAEKTGKSSFINAWIGADLLPNKQVRCTFTTTRLHSVIEDRDQRLEVKPKTKSEFEDLISNLTELKNSPDSTQATHAQEDLDLITLNRDQMESIVGQKIEPIQFRTLDGIAEDLEKFTADPRYAHAISEVDLYTKSLANMDGILFYDVPGIDSGLEKHRVETRKMLEDSDAVIMVKRFGEPQMKDHEKEILRYVESGDSSIPIKDKLFFFLSRIDDQKTRDGFLANQKDILKECSEYKIDQNKIVFGAAAAVLALEDKLKDNRYIDPKPKLKKHLAMLLDLPDEDDDTVKNAVGIKELRMKMEHYLETEREEILRRSCDKLVNEVLARASGIKEAVKAQIPENPEDMRKSHDKEQNKAFNNWFEKFWQDILSLASKDNSQEHIKDSLKTMEVSYIKNVKDAIGSLNYYQPEEREKFFDKIKFESGSDDLERMNAQIREKINEEIIVSMQDLALKLSMDLYDQLMQYIDQLGEHFNHSFDLEKILLEKMRAYPKESYKRQLESAMSALFLRYARPLARGLMQHRHGIAARKEEARKNSGAFYALSNSYSESSPIEFAQLIKYIGGTNVIKKSLTIAAQTGVATAKEIKEATLKKIVPTVVGVTAGGPIGAIAGAAVGEILTKADDALLKSPDIGKPDYKSRQDIVDELEKDRNALEAYLSDAIFSCSGIGDYADSEHDRIQRIFNESKVDIHAELHAEFGYQNPKLIQLLPSCLRSSECDTRVVDLFQQLSIALQSRL